MATSESLSLGTLTLADVAGGLALSSGAGWNQTADDWAFFIEHGHAIGFRTASGTVVATAAAIVYSGGLGWISMVLVAPQWRHRGLASLLVENCIQRLRSVHVTPVLDATPAGEPVYRHLGFRAGFDLERWEGLGAPGETASHIHADVRHAVAGDLDIIAALDRAANGVGRRALLHNLLARRGTQAWIARDGSGFVVARAGQRATQVGPLVASQPDAAVTLLTTTLQALAGPVFLDVPRRCDALAQRLEQLSFTRQRPYVRMALGAATPLACGDRMFVLAGPEFG